VTSTEQTLGQTITRAPDATGRLDEKALDQLFREARSFSYWQDRPVEEAAIRELYDLLKMGPTSANTSPARFVFVRSEDSKARLARQSGTLQGAYLMMAARSLGLDCGPMLGDNERIEAEFFPGRNWKLNFVCAIGYGMKDKLYPRLPRLDFSEAAVLL